MADVGLPSAGRARLALGGVVLVALAVRLLALRELAAGPCFAFLEPGLDADLYHRIARGVARGGPVAEGSSSSLFGLALGAVYALLGERAYAARIANLALGCGTVWLVGAYTARLLGSRIAGLVAASGMAAYAPAVFADTSRLKVSLGLFLAALALLVLALERERRTWRLQLALGVVAALALDLNRLLVPVVLLAIAGMRLSAWRERRSRGPLPGGAGGAGSGRAWSRVGSVGAGLALGGLALALLPGRGGPSEATHAAIHLYVGNHRGASGAYAEVPGVADTPRGHVRDSRRVAEAALGRPLTDFEVASWWTGRTVADALEHPGDLAARLAAKASLLVSPYEVPNDEDLQDWARQSGLASLLPGWGLLLPLALAGALLALIGLPGVSRGGVLVLVVSAGAYAAGLLLFFVAWRYRLPLALLLWPCAGALAAVAVRALRDRRPAAALAAAILPLLLAAPLSAAGQVPASRLRRDAGLAAARVERCRLDLHRRDLRDAMQARLRDPSRTSTASR